ncbi:hypothetical protein M422DRAFT_244421 [Sphaerobolus stellatus SS14]|nr:hypothetical protein M422DRAFT_244421 [Sphaerobolus stellatus SS14]
MDASNVASELNVSQEGHRSDPPLTTNGQITLRDSNNFLGVYIGPGRVYGNLTQMLGRKLETEVGRLAHKMGRGSIATSSSTCIVELFGGIHGAIQRELNILNTNDTRPSNVSPRDREWLKNLQQACDRLMSYIVPTHAIRALISNIYEDHDSNVTVEKTAVSMANKNFFQMLLQLPNATKKSAELKSAKLRKLKGQHVPVKF